MQGWFILLLGLVGVSASLAASTSQYGAVGVGEHDVRSGVGQVTKARNKHPTVSAKRRVVSASLLSDELLLGVLPEASWIGVSYVVDWPSATAASAAFSSKIPRSSGTIEDLLTRRPDLVVLSSYNNAFTYAQLLNLGLDVHVVAAPQTFEELFSTWHELGRIIGYSAQAGVQIARAERQLYEVRALGLKLRHAMQASHVPSALLLQGMFSYGPDTLQGRCLEEAGLVNALTESPGHPSPQLNVEYIVKLAPEIVFYAADVTAPRPARASDLAAEPLLLTFFSGLGTQVFVIPGSWMASISHYALLACRSYAESALSRLAHQTAASSTLNTTPGDTR